MFSKVNVLLESFLRVGGLGISLREQESPIAALPVG